MKKSVFLFFFILSILGSCRSNKAVVKAAVSYQLSKDIKITEAYLQEEIPGQKDEVSKHFLTIKIEKESLTKEIRIDSIEFETKYYPLSSDSGRSVTKTTIRLKLEKGTILTQSINAFVFYTKNEQAFKQTVSFMVKPPIYLP
ncbi:MAG: hypothetical protein JKY48_12010 [Flavobacteriales bacterium]|nr:hypothetical protein [Flavobacteriales bacterium]